jgi:peptidoglycan/LPS O-acetylase OafA/YrhL
VEQGHAKGAARRLLIPADRDGFYANNFDMIRLAMALLVMWSHCWALYSNEEHLEPLARATNGFYSAGNIGVWVFFIISGFLITGSLEKSRSLRSYFGKRIRRIYPGYIVATSICAFIITPIFAPPGFSLTAGEVMKTLGLNLLLDNHFPVFALFADNPMATVNGSLWSIKFEFLCYVGTSLLCLVALWQRRWATLAVYIVIVAIWCWLDLTGRKPGENKIIFAIIGWPYRWFLILPNFLAGALAYLHRDRLLRSTPLLAGALIACLAVLNIGGAAPWGIIAGHILVPPTMAYLVLWTAYHPRIPGRNIARYGDFSYGTYLYAFIIQQMLVATTTLPFWLFVIVSMALALLAGAASWYLVERHFLRSGGDPTEHEPKKKRRPLRTERPPLFINRQIDQTTP